jgi:hypothetical protein
MNEVFTSSPNLKHESNTRFQINHRRVDFRYILTLYKNPAALLGENFLQLLEEMWVKMATSRLNSYSD